ncbi:MAG: hypothetical protein ABSE48_13195 [Verrucomicrobiota bacterium]
MKKLSVFFAFALAVLTGRAVLPQPDLIADVHFAGGQNISNDRSFLPFADEFSSPEARALANQTFDKLSHAPFAWFKAKIAANAGNGAAQLRPLFNDLLSSPWVFEARDTTNGFPESALAIRLSSDRVQLWQKNLQQLLEAWTKLPVRRIPGGWELKKDLPPNLIRVTANNGFLVLDCGQNQLVLGESVVGSLAHGTSIGGVGLSGEKDWLAADINWPRLSQWFAGLKALSLPETRLVVSPKDNDLHVAGRLLFPENLPAKLPDWQIPQTLIHSPFVSLTAARGFALWLNSQAWAEPYQISPVPDQVFIWALPNIPFQTYMCVPVPDAKSALAQSYARLNPAFDAANRQNGFFSPIKIVMTNSEIRLVGVPYAAPFLQATNDHQAHYLFAGAFPDTLDAKPLPPALFTQLDKSNLAYYHWEITAERFPQLLELTQLGLLMTQHQQLGTDSASLKWLRKITPRLGNTVTEAFRTTPDEMTFTRSAPGGLTAFEFLALGNWLEAKNFPGCDLRLPPDNPAFNNQAAPSGTASTAMLATGH